MKERKGTKKWNSKTKEERKAEMDELMARLDEGVTEVFETKYEEFLKTMSKFHHYSFNNCLLIALQMPTATRVAGFETWKKLGRHVLQGQKAIHILRPVTKTVWVETDEDVVDATGATVKKKVKRQYTTFDRGNVFDVSQTAGKELPTLGVDELDGSVERFEEFVEAVKDVAPVPVRFGEPSPNPDVKGCYNRATGEIVVRDGMPQAQALKTLCHETAHAMLHNEEEMAKNPLEREVKEVEAESVAYVVCAHFGVEADDYSFGYVAGWAGSMGTKALKDSGNRIQKAAKAIIDGVEAKLAKTADAEAETTDDAVEGRAAVAAEA